MTISPYDPFATGALQIHEDPSEDGRNHSHLSVRPDLRNYNGVLHGGVTFSLIDQSMGAALDSLAGPGQSNTTIELKVNYLEPVASGRVDCDSTVIRRGGRIAVIEADVHNQGRLVAKGLGTYALIRAANPLPNSPPPPTPA